MTESNIDIKIMRAGLPPHVGWWLTAVLIPNFSTLEMWRWCDGQSWSLGVSQWTTSDVAADMARYETPVIQDLIYWCDYWPEDARVERIVP